MNSRILGEALYLAVKDKKKAEVIKLLDEPYIDLNWQCPETGNTALHGTAEDNEYEFALLLLDKEASAEIKNNKGLTAIYSAVDAGNWSFVTRFAKRRKAKVGDDYGRALLTAAQKNEYDPLLALLEAGAPTNWEYTDTKKSALHYAAEQNAYNMIRALRSYSASLSAQDATNKTPVDIATDCAKRNGDYAAVLAFTEQTTLPKKTKPTIEDLEDVILTVSKRPYLTYYSRADWLKMKITGTDDFAGFCKDSILEQILNLKNPELKQKALWQALDPNTFLGKFFRYQRNLFKPQINAGRLKRIRIALQAMLLKYDVMIDDEVKNNIYHDIQIIRYFPKLISVYPICRLPQIISDVTMPLPSDQWYKEVYGAFSWGNPDNKEYAFAQINNIADLNQRQRALWQALDPNTYLGKIFHTKRTLFKPNYRTGNLKEICLALADLLRENELVIDAHVKDFLRFHPYLYKKFPILRNGKPLIPAEYDRHQEEKDDAPPDYFQAIASGPPGSNKSSTALIIQAGHLVPQSASETLGSHLLVSHHEVKDEQPSAPHLHGTQLAASAYSVAEINSLPMPLSAEPADNSESRTETANRRMEMQI